MLQVSLLALMIASSASSSAAIENHISPRQALDSSTSITARYFDPFRERPFLTAAGSIDDHFDIEATLNCDGQTCRGALRLLPSLLGTARPSAESCRTPNYARIELRQADGTLIRLYVDYTGRCISLGGKSFVVAESVIRFLRNHLVADW